MKKTSCYLFLAALTVLMGSCAFMKGKAELNVSIDEYGNDHIGEKIYLYYSPVKSEVLADPKQAEDVKTIESDGYAHFIIGAERFLVDEKRTVYLEMFDTKGTVIARKGFTISAGSRVWDYLTIGEIK